MTINLTQNLPSHGEVMPLYSNVKDKYFRSSSNYGFIDKIKEEESPKSIFCQTPVNTPAPTTELLLWCQRVTKGSPIHEIKDFSTDWETGLPFCALIHKFRPDLM